jgi:nucleotide-binding universal stress UspA family protein
MTTLEPYVPPYAEDEGQAMERARSEAVDTLQREALSLRNEGLTVRCDAVFDSDAGRGIIRYAEGLAPLFVAMATHGRGGLDHALHGSVCEAVIRSGVAPVLVVRP